MNNSIEEKRNELNLSLRELLAIIDMIDGNTAEYKNYIENTLNEYDFLTQQIELVNNAKTRMLNIFKN